MYTRYKTHYTVCTQQNQLNKNTLQYGSSTSEVRDLYNLLSDVKSVLHESGFLYDSVIETIGSYVRFAGWEVQFIIVTSSKCVEAWYEKVTQRLSNQTAVCR